MRDGKKTDQSKAQGTKSVKADSAHASARSTAADIVFQVLYQKRSLSPLLEALDGDDINLVRAIVFGSIRHHRRLQFFLSALMRKPLANKDKDVEALLLTAVFQLSDMQQAEHAVVNETVNTIAKHKRQWARGLVNGVLRQFIRSQDDLQKQLQKQSPAVRYSFPDWLFGKLKKRYPEHWQRILEQSNQQAAMTVRVNSTVNHREAYLASLEKIDIAASACHFSDTGIRLEQAVNPTSLPDFAQGSCYVQDEAAQLASQLLSCNSDARILDACAAPGGKTTHIRERYPNAELHAVDISASRLERVQQNFTRLGLKPPQQCHALNMEDATQVAKHLEPLSYDSILLDVPCTATGVIRRHPDIKIHRQVTDLEALLATQQTLLNQAWMLLKPGGVLLYTTCSILMEENAQQVSRFVEQQADAALLSIDLFSTTLATGDGEPYAHAVLDSAGGVQVLPGQHGMDGFYYARLEKHIKS